MNRLRDMREGRAYKAEFGTRMKGSGLWADLIRQRFDKASARLGLGRGRFELREDLFRKPKPTGPQLDLF
jgi:hypothetical protein